MMERLGGEIQGLDELGKILIKLPKRVVTASKTKALRAGSGEIRKGIRGKVPNVTLRFKWGKRKGESLNIGKEIRKSIKNQMRGRGFEKYAVIRPVGQLVGLTSMLEFGTLSDRSEDLAPETLKRMGTKTDSSGRVSFAGRSAMVKAGLGLKKRPFMRAGFNASKGKAMAKVGNVFIEEIPKQVDKLVKKGKVSGFVKV